MPSESHVPAEHEQRLRERVESGLCITIHRDGRQCGSPIVARGLCSNCRQHWHIARRKQGTQEAMAQFEADAIAEGKILPRGTQGQWMTKNPFLTEA